MAREDEPNVKGPRVLKIPPGDTHPRLMCLECGYIAYENPKVVVGSVASAGDRVLLCRRAIDPRKGYWTLPAGFLELKESPLQGALREAMEEANARLEIDALLAVYSIAHISQVQLIYRARLLNEPTPGPESLEVALFSWEQIPWRELAFPSVGWALEDHRRTRALDVFPPGTNPPSPSE